MSYPPESSDRGRAAVRAALVAAAAASAGLALQPRAARAVVYLYAGGFTASPTAWGQAANWYNTAAGAINNGFPGTVSTDVAIFDDAGVANAASGSGVPAAIVTGANRLVGQIAFGNGSSGLATLSNAGDATFSINNNTITLASATANGVTAAIYRNTATVGTQTINSNLILNKTGEIFNLAGSTGSVVINGVISEGTANGGFTLDKLSGGTLELNNANTFTGAFTVTAGSVIVDNAQALGLGTTDVMVGTATAASGAALFTNSGVTFSRNVTTVADPATAVSSQLGAALNQTSSTWTGTVTLGRDTALNIQSGTVDFQGLIQNGTGVAANVAKSSGGTAMLSAAETFTGTYTSIGGTTVLNNNAALSTAAAVVGSAPTATSAGALLTNPGINFSRAVTVASAVNTAGPAGGSLQYGYTLGGVAAATTSTWSGNLALNQPTNLTGGTAGVVAFTGAIADGTGGTYTFNATNAAYPFVSSAVTKVDAGTVVLSGANTYTGGTTVAAGTLVANGSSGSPTGTGPVTVAAGVLAGNGMIGNTAGPVTIAGGTITAGSGATAGDTIGTLTITGLQAWNASGAYVAKVTAGTGAGNDQLVLSGGLTVTGPFTVDLLSQGTTALAANQSLTLAVIPGGVQGTFNVSSLNLATTNVSVPTGYAVQLFDVTVGGNDDLLAEVVVAAPEPTSLLLAVAAAAPLTLARRRRAARH